MGAGARSAAGAFNETPYLGQGSEQASMAGHVAAPGASAGAQGGRCSSSARTAHPTGAPSATLLLTPSALLIDVNIAPSDPGETSFLSSGNSKLKKKKSWSSSGLPAAGDANPHSAPSRLHPPSQPQLAAAGDQKSIRSRRRPGAQADKTSPRGQGRSLALLWKR